MSTEASHRSTRPTPAEEGIVRQVIRGDSRGPATKHTVTPISMQVGSMLLGLIAVSMFEVVVADQQFDSTFWLRISLAWGGVLAGAIWLRRIAARWPEPPFVSPILVLAGLVGPLGELSRRAIWGTGLPFELATMAMLRNIVLALALVSVWGRFQRPCAVMSLFLILFGATAGDSVGTHLLAIAFAVAGVVWLGTAHWENVRRRLHGQDATLWPRWLTLLVIVALLVGGASAAPVREHVAKSLRGWLPSSGGTGSSDPFARNGVGDGELVVAGTERIQTFAPLDDAPFMEDDQPSLYDIFDETYNEEFNVSKTDRAVSLSPELVNRAKEHLHSRTEKAQRSFSTRRQPRQLKQVQAASDLRSKALFYVAGRVPLHLRMVTYDRFDGERWYPEPDSTYQPPLGMTESQGKPWLALPDRGESREFLGPAELHAIKIVNLDSNRIPVPLFLHGVHIDRVDRADMFLQSAGGVIAMDRDRLPTLVPIHLASRSVDAKALFEEQRLFLKVPSDDPYHQIPATVNHGSLARLARSWTREATTGWGEIDAIIERLRREYVHDRVVTATVTDEAPVEDFLFESHAGPDYQFATAAALLLRSLGYTTRLVSGFYADPERFDIESRHTPVFADDVHFWVEVRAA